MSLGSDPRDFSHRLLQGAFRNAAAGLIKSLIRARARQEPDFLAAEVYERWGVTGLESETRCCAELLTHVRRLQQQFERQYLVHQCSVSEPVAAFDTIERCAERVAGFICGDLREAIGLAARGKPVPWERLAAGDQLAGLRNTLDQLPSAAPSSACGTGVVARSQKVLLYGLREPPVVNGREKPPLSLSQYKLVRAILEAGEEGLTKTPLETVSSDYWKALAALKRSDADWNEVIQFPGSGGRGYWIVRLCIVLDLI